MQGAHGLAPRNPLPCSLLAGAGALAGSARAARADDAAGVASSRMSYSRFLEYLEMGRVKKVRISSGDVAVCTLLVRCRGRSGHRGAVNGRLVRQGSTQPALCMAQSFGNSGIGLPACKCAAPTLFPSPTHPPACPFVQVDLYENGTIAIVEAVSPELGNRIQRVRVQLPGTSSELLQKFR